MVQQIGVGTWLNIGAGGSAFGPLGAVKITGASGTLVVETVRSGCVFAILTVGAVGGRVSGMMVMRAVSLRGPS